MAEVSNVFVVHGRNTAARKAMFEFLRAIGLQPIEWSRAVAATSKGAPYVGEVLEKGFEMAQAVVVLFTPDDEARLKTPYHQATDSADETELRGQPRQNVLLEAGMALGTHRDRTVLVEIGNLRPISDIQGRHAIRFDGSFKQRQELAQRLETAGCSVDRTGTDWHDAGDFLSCVTADVGTASKVAEPDFMQYLDGLSGCELYYVALAVVNRTQTITGCGVNDEAPYHLVSKHMLEKVPMDTDDRNRFLSYTIPTIVWRYVNVRKIWLVEQAISKNHDRPDRLKELRPALERIKPVDEPSDLEITLDSDLEDSGGVWPFWNR